MRHFSPISQTFIYDTIHLLQQNNIDNHVATIVRENNKDRPFTNVHALLGDYREKNYSFNILSKSFWKLFFESPRDFFIKFVRMYFFCVCGYFLQNKLKRICKNIKPDIIHSHFGLGFYDLYRIIKEECFEYPLVISFHGRDITSMPKKDKKYLNVLLKASTKKNVLFTVNSNYLKRACTSLGLAESKIHVTYNTANDIFLNVRKKQFKKNINSIKIINVGRFVSVKGQKYLIRAFAKFHKEYPQSELTLIGSGQKQGDLEQLVNQLKIQSNVSLIGDIKHSLIPEILCSHDVYVHPSIVDPVTHETETFGVAVLEAIFVGLPVIISNCGGMPEVVGEKYLNKFAFIVPEKDSNAIYKTLKFMVSSEYEFQNNSEYVKDRLKLFSKEKYLERLENIYNKFIA